jgi:hypothetical protein
MPADDWLGRVGHDLVKRLLWPARDRRDLGGPVVPGELAAPLGGLVDDDGAPITAQALWGQLCAGAPAVAPAALAAFGAALERAVSAAAADDLDGVLALEQAHAHLARIVKQGAR